MNNRKIMASLRLQALFVFNLVLLLQFGTHQCTMVHDPRNMRDDDNTTSTAKLVPGEKLKFCFPNFCHRQQLQLRPQGLECEIGAETGLIEHNIRDLKVNLRSEVRVY
ncbi:hypothetical protein POM88_000740 [Heracleum sosnowskyi]|uniref:Uncharacterized protein n=1 Tax=Heracleum sosnowskyi TaxID=360622 RepID=A0AAD8JAW2_9APIA|nr:hypothetical protein POM88_000740 [Heracleum sosnowskyi]